MNNNQNTGIDDMSTNKNDHTTNIEASTLSDYPVKKTAIIAAGSIIHGNIQVDEPLSIRGHIHGDVECTDRIDSRNGHKVFGSIKADSAYFVGGELVGDIVCVDRVELDAGCTLKGNIQARSILIAGHVDGNLNASESIQLSESAVVKGDLVASAFIVQRGALLEGQCSIKKQDE